MFIKTLILTALISTIEINDDMKKRIYEEKNKINSKVMSLNPDIMFKVKNFNFAKLNKKMLRSGESVDYEFAHPNYMMMFAEIDLGNKDDEYHILIDTGSFELFVDSDKCRTCNSHCKKMTCTEDKGCYLTNKKDSMSYGSGTVMGRLAYIDLFVNNKMINKYKFLLVDEATDGVRSL